MTWMLTVLTVKDRDLVVSCLRADADRREKAAKESSLRLVTDGEEGRTIPVKAQRGVRDLHESAETLRALAWELERQEEVSAVMPAHDVVEEERAATYPPLEAVTPMAESVNTTEAPRRTKTARRGVKVVEFRPEDEERAAAMAAHPSSQTPTQEDQS